MPDVPKQDIQKTVYKMVDDGEIEIEGGKRNRTYQIPKKNK